MSDGSGLFVRQGSTGSRLNVSRRGDLNSDNATTPRARRRIIMDENGQIIRDVSLEGVDSEAPTFSNLDPNTSDAQAMGGTSSMNIWGTNVSIMDSMSTFKDFLRNYCKKYRMWADGMSVEETDADEESSTKEYMQMMQNMLQLGVTSLNLDFRNLKAYPPTKKLWQQAQDYPQDIITLMDQGVKDIMYEIAEAEMAKRRQPSVSSMGDLASQRTRGSRVMSSEPPVPSSDLSEPEGARTPRANESYEVDWCAEVQKAAYRVRPFGLDSTVNMRELNPSGKLW
jgi:DNA replication licensing factor MCM4